MNAPALGYELLLFSRYHAQNIFLFNKFSWCGIGHVAMSCCKNNCCYDFCLGGDSSPLSSLTLFVASNKSYLNSG